MGLLLLLGNNALRDVSGSYFNVSDFLTRTSGRAIIYLLQIVATTRELSEMGLLCFFSRTEHFFFKTILLKREKFSNTKILIRSTDFNVNIFLL